MSHLDGRVLSVLDRARQVHQPSDLDRHRVLRKLAPKVSFSAGSAVAEADFSEPRTLVPPPAARTAARVRLPLPAAMAAAALIAGSVSFGVGFYSGRVTAPVRQAHPALPAAAESPSAPAGAVRRGAKRVELEERQAARSQQAEREKATAGELVPSAATSNAVAAPPSARAASSARQASPAPPKSGKANLSNRPGALRQNPSSEGTATSAAEAPQENPKNSAQLLGDEIVLLRRAQRALHEGSPRLALLLVNELATLYPAGALREEANVVRALALCDLGQQAEATAAARRILQRNPRSIHAARLRSSCASKVEKSSAGVTESP